MEKGKRKDRDPFPRAIGGMSEEAVAVGGGNVGGGIAGQVRAHVADLKDGTPAKVALAASQLRVLVGDSAGKVRSWFLLRARCDRSFFLIIPKTAHHQRCQKLKELIKRQTSTTSFLLNVLQHQVLHVPENVTDQPAVR